MTQKKQKKPSKKDDKFAEMREQLISVSEEVETRSAYVLERLELILDLSEYNEDLKKPKLREKLTEINEIALDIMGTMQYQDIIRQKIQRVAYNMSSDSKKKNMAPVAKHLHGDENPDLVNDDELEALIASMKNG